MMVKRHFSQSAKKESFREDHTLAMPPGIAGVEGPKMRD
jgi:hypothetical protein